MPPCTASRCTCLAREVLASPFEDAEVSVQADEAMPAVQADAPRLRLLLRNLLGNALRHSAGAPWPPQLALRIEQGQLRIAVHDHGQGVNDEQLARLAEPFYRTDAARARAISGVGLGLYLCRLVAQAHGGDLRLEHAHPGLRVAAAWPAIAPAAGQVSVNASA